MAKGLPDYMENFPYGFKEKKKACVIKKSDTKRFIYPHRAAYSDLNWLYVSTDRLFFAVYTLAPGSTFAPSDVHAGDEVYYILSGAVTLLNPETGQVVELKEGDGVLMPEGTWHKAYNFEKTQARIVAIIAPTAWPPEGLPEEGYPGDMQVL